jgi:hypothetical protein
VLLFGYAMMWRYVFPNIDASSEKIADLAFVCNYYPGETLPVRDVWFYPYLSTNYYSFQYYAAALLGRILGIEPGAAYNIAFCVLIGMAFTAGVGAVCQATKKFWIRLLVSMGWIFGGSGLTILIHFLSSDVIPCNNFRFIGTAVLALDKAPLGTWLAAYAKQWVPPGNTVPMDLPGEQISYSTFLGDYHPPLAGFYLLALGLLTLNLWANGASRWVLFLAGASLPWCAVADTWNLPLEALGLGAWALYNSKGILNAWCWFHNKVFLYLRRYFPFLPLYSDSLETYWIQVRPGFMEDWRNLRYLLLGAVVAMLAVYPYFRVFAYSAETYHSALKWVASGFHTPPLLWFMFLFPTIGITLLALISRNKLLSALGILWLGYLLFTECFYINDIYSGSYVRFNTTLKWWPWVGAGVLLTVGPKLLELRPRSIRWYVALVLILYPLGYMYDLGRAWSYLPWSYVGQLNGGAYYESTSEKANGQKPLLDYLKLQPRGITAEHPENDFTNDGALPLFANQPAYIGWLGHEQLWRGYLPELTYRRESLESFYAGNMPDAGNWMRHQGIEYILWFKTDVDLDSNWEKANASLGPDIYYWHEFYREGDHRVGLWELKKAPSDQDTPANFNFGPA